MRTREAAHHLLAQDFFSLCASATRLRQAAFGDRVELCAIINAKSGNCGMDCRFCAQSGHYHGQAPTFALLDVQELDQRIAALRPYPVRHCGLVTSGGKLGPEELEQVAAVLRAHRVEPAGTERPHLCASLGRLAPEQLDVLREAGLTRYHHNLESAEAFYPQVCTTQSWRERLATVKAAQAVGLDVCCGGLFGLGEGWDERIDFALSLAAEGIRNIPMNFLYPQPGTPLAEVPPLQAEEALRIIALFRHILPQATLRICGGRTLVLGERQDEIFAAGANALMTGDYLTTSGQTVRNDLAMIARLGLTVSA